MRCTPFLLSARPGIYCHSRMAPLGWLFKRTGEAEATVGSDGMQVLSAGEAPIKADIVFVHGLRGDRVKTWSHGDVCWPKDLLPAMLHNNARIMTVANAGSYASAASMFGHAEDLLNDIALERATSEERSRPIVFVGHSLGGLVIKEAALRSKEYLDNKQHANLGAIFAYVAGFVFLGSPHRGSSKEAYAQMIADVASFCLRQPNKKLLRVLSPDSDVLERQRSSFTSISQSLPIICIYEQLPTPLGIIVPQYSACMDGFNVKTLGIPANHSDMCKFQSAEETGFKRTAGHIISLVEEAVNKTEALERGESSYISSSAGKQPPWLLPHEHQNRFVLPNERNLEFVVEEVD